MSSSPDTLSRGNMLRAMLLVLVGALSIQLSAALSSALFGSLGPAAVSSLRFQVAAVCMLIIIRPRIRGRSRREWLGIAVYGGSMAAMNLSLLLAIERIPLGVAVTLEFLGPCAVALLASRRLGEGLCALLALAGVVLIAGPGGTFDLIGYAWALGAGVCFALYTVFAARVGKRGDGLSGLALSVSVAALVSAPFGVSAIPSVTLPEWGIVLLIAVTGVLLPFTADSRAARGTSARVMGTLFSLQPLAAALIGALFLGQLLTPVALGGVALVILAGAGIVWLAGHRPDHRLDHRLDHSTGRSSDENTGSAGTPRSPA